MAAPNRDTAMELLGIPAEYQDQVAADFAKQWGGVGTDAYERALRDGGEDDEFSRAFALLALARSGTPTMAMELRPYLNDPSLLVRIASAVSLGYIGDPASLPHLRKLIATPPASGPGRTDEESILDGLCLGLVWGCIPEILGDLGDQDGLAALRQALIHAQSDPDVDVPTRNARVQSLIYTAGRLSGWTLLDDVQNATSRQDLALLMALGFLHDRMVAERARHLSGGRLAIPARLLPERSAGELIEGVLTQRFGYSPVQAHALTESKTTDAYLVSGRLLSSIEQHRQLFAPPQPAAPGAPS